MINIPLDHTQIPFDNQTLNYDLEKYPLPQIILEVLQKYNADITELDMLHKHIDIKDVSDVMKKASRDLIKTDFYKLFDQMIEEQIVPKVGEVVVQKFGNLRALVPNQDHSGQVLLFHQGRWVGNGLGLRTVWMPFTPCFEGNSMQIMDLDISRKLTRQSVFEKWSYDRLQSTCLEHCWPVTLQPGQAHLFFQEHIHGNIPNRTDKTRVSIDIRLAVKNGQVHRKWPGAYFRRLHDHEFVNRIPVIRPTDKVLTYGGFEGIKMRHLDLFFQTTVVKMYCDRLGIKFPYQHGENEGTHLSFLEWLMKNSNADHLLLPSFFNMPEDPEHRVKMMNNALDSGLTLHFCNEELFVQSKEDIEKVEFLRTWTDDWSSPVEQLKEELGI